MLHNVTHLENQVGGYRLGACIGCGGTSRVYEAQHSHLPRTVAVKLLHPEFVGLVDIERMFLREARLLDALEHPSIPKVYDAGRTYDGRPYCAMELVRGRSLDQWQLDDDFALDSALACAAELARTLADIHDCGYVHRDIKLENVLVEDFGDPRSMRLIDFGLCLPVGDDAPMYLAGTPRSMAPEQVMHCAIDPRLDIWSLGVLIYELASGQTPFADNGGGIDGVLRQVVEDAPIPLPEHLPDSLRDLTDRCLAKDPRDRPSSGRAVARVLDAIVSELRSTRLDAILECLEIECAAQKLQAAKRASTHVTTLPPIPPSSRRQPTTQWIDLERRGFATPTSSADVGPGRAARHGATERTAIATRLSRDRRIVAPARSLHPRGMTEPLRPCERDARPLRRWRPGALQTGDDV